MSSSSSRRKCPSIPLDEIKDATNHFDEQKVLGKGGESTVYLAKLYIGLKKTLVAVKHLKPNSSEFENEIQIMTKMQHPNIVSLLGHCKQSGQKILIYEYMENGSLAKYVRGKRSVSLPWQQRLKICLDAARGLQRLHRETDEFPKGIIHRDVKPDNILLDGNWVGKISDFGMFKLSHAGQTKSAMTTLLKGTAGYYAPEYLAHKRVSRKSDVYAFGVVMFEVLCLKTPWDRGDDSYFHNEDEDLGEWAQKNIDTRIKNDISDNSLKIFTEIIGRSLHKEPNRRPTIDVVVLQLEKALECQNFTDEAKRYRGSTSTSSLHSKAVARCLEDDIDDGDEEEEDDEEAEAEEEEEEDFIFPQKIPPGGIDKVVLYADDQSVSTGAVNILNQYNVDVEMRSILHPIFRYELQNLVGSTRCPRLFVRGMDIGGIDNIGKFHKSKKLEKLLNMKVTHLDFPMTSPYPYPYPYPNVSQYYLPYPYPGYNFQP